MIEGNTCRTVHIAHRNERTSPGERPYYGAFYRAALYALLTRIDAYLMRWLGSNKYKRLRGRKKHRTPGRCRAPDTWT